MTTENVSFILQKKTHGVFGQPTTRHFLRGGAGVLQAPHFVLMTSGQWWDCCLPPQLLRAGSSVPEGRGACSSPRAGKWLFLDTNPASDQDISAFRRCTLSAISDSIRLPALRGPPKTKLSHHFTKDSVPASFCQGCSASLNGSHAHKCPRSPVRAGTASCLGLLPVVACTRPGPKEAT